MFKQNVPQRTDNYFNSHWLFTNKIFFFLLKYRYQQLILMFRAYIGIKLIQWTGKTELFQDDEEQWISGEELRTEGSSDEEIETHIQRRKRKTDYLLKTLLTSSLVSCDNNKKKECFFSNLEANTTVVSDEPILNGKVKIEQLESDNDKITNEHLADNFNYKDENEPSKELKFCNKGRYRCNI